MAANALAGPMHNVFLLDVTAAIGRCGNCGRSGPMAKARVFSHAPEKSSAVRYSTRSSCGWCVVPAVPGSTCPA